MHTWVNQGPMLLGSILMLENYCTRTAQSSHGGCSGRVHKIVYLAVTKGNISVIFFISENIHRKLLLRLNPVVYLLKKCGLSDRRNSARAKKIRGQHFRSHTNLTSM